MSLSGTWPAILYDESMVDSNGNDDSELAGLFRSETLLRVRSPPMYLSHLVLLMRSRVVCHRCSMQPIRRTPVDIPRARGPVIRFKPERVQRGDQRNQGNNTRNDSIYFNPGLSSDLLLNVHSTLLVISQAVFAVHDSDCFTRNLGGIDLSELYHDVVATLRLKTNWTTETLKFWNS